MKYPMRIKEKVYGHPTSSMKNSMCEKKFRVFFGDFKLFEEKQVRRKWEDV